MHSLTYLLTYYMIISCIKLLCQLLINESDDDDTRCPRKKETKKFFVMSPTNLGWFWWNSANRFLNTFASTWCHRFPSHLNNVSYTTFWNLKCSLRTCYRWVVTEKKNCRIYPTSIVTLRITQLQQLLSGQLQLQKIVNYYYNYNNYFITPLVLLVGSAFIV